MDNLKLIIIFSLLLLLFPLRSNATLNGSITSAARASGGGVAAVVAGQLEFQKLLSRTITVSAESANAAMLRRMAASTPVGLLLVAGLAAYNYYYDTQTGKIRTRNTFPDTGLGNCRGPFAGYFVRKNLSDCAAYSNAMYPTRRPITFYKFSSGIWGANYSNPDGSYPYAWQADNDDNAPVGTVASPASELSEDQLTAFREGQSSVSPKQILSDNGVADRQVPEIAAQLDDMEADHAAATDTNADGSPNTATQPTTGTVPGDNGLESLVSDSASTSETDCDKYPNALGCVPIDRILDNPVDPGPLDPVVQDVPVTFSPTLSYEGSCPTLQPISIKGHSISLSTAPMCEFAVSIKPIVLALASLVAAGIVMGLNKTNDQ